MTIRVARCVSSDASSRAYARRSPRENQLNDSSALTVARLSPLDRFDLRDDTNERAPLGDVEGDARGDARGDECGGPFSRRFSHLGIEGVCFEL